MEEKFPASGNPAQAGAVYELAKAFSIERLANVVRTVLDKSK